jgi:hypothetical protein
MHSLLSSPSKARLPAGVINIITASTEKTPEVCVCVVRVCWSSGRDILCMHTAHGVLHMCVYDLKCVVVSICRFMDMCTSQLCVSGDLPVYIYIYIYIYICIVSCVCQALKKPWTIHTSSMHAYKCTCAYTRKAIHVHGSWVTYAHMCMHIIHIIHIHTHVQIHYNRHLQGGNELAYTVLLLNAHAQTHVLRYM